MNRRNLINLCCAIVVTQITAACPAQTERPCAPPHLFVLPEITLRPMVKDTPAKSHPELGASMNVEISTPMQGAGTDDFEAYRQRYEYMNGSGLLTRVKHIDQGGFYYWAKDKILDIEVVQFKGVKVAGSLVTAIKRKNPLYLISPFFLAVAW